VKHILVTTDFSDLADGAIAPAAELARGLGAKLTLAHVVISDKATEPDPDAPYFKVAQRLYQADLDLEAQVTTSLRERAQKVQGVDVGVAVGRGDPVQGIIKVAKNIDADLVVISSQGRTGLARMILGSVAEEMARVSPIPVLIWKRAPQA
jgi:nucleotide-binding universal stress UspA family protein